MGRDNDLSVYHSNVLAVLVSAAFPVVSSGPKNRPWADSFSQMDPQRTQCPNDFGRARIAAWMRMSGG
jgi:hypothetical protein